jgi:tetratricopeptide (TPR) repeat protein
MRMPYLLALGMAFCLLPSSLLGQSPLTDEQKQKANTLISKAESDFSVQDYAEALAGYQAVYDIVGDPELFYNIAQCYRLSGQAKEAVNYYQRYLKEAKDSLYRQSALEWLDKLLPLLPKEEPASQVFIQSPPPNDVQIKPFLLPGGFLVGGLAFGAATLVIKQKAKEGDQPVSLKRAGMGVSIIADVSFLFSGASFALALRKRSSERKQESASALTANQPEEVSK